MDRRNELRFGADHPVVVSVLGNSHSDGIPGKIAGASKSGLRVLTDVPIDVTSSVRVKWDAGALTGDVRHCRQVRPGHYSIGIRINQVIQPSKLRTDQLESAFD